MRQRSQRPAFGRYLGLYALAFGLGPGCDCRGPQPELNCDERLAQYESVAAGEGVLLDAIPDDNNPDPFQVLQDEDLNTKLEYWLGQLNDKQRIVVERRFGLGGKERATLEEVGNEIGVTRERVRQIQIDALRRLRKILEAEGFSEDVLYG